jgi:hypothetical protein
MDPQHWTVANHEFNTLRIRIQQLTLQGGRYPYQGSQINADPIGSGSGSGSWSSFFVKLYVEFLQLILTYVVNGFLNNIHT